MDSYRDRMFSQTCTDNNCTSVFLMHPSTFTRKDPRLHTDEVLIALSMCAVSDPKAKLALEQLPKLSGCQLHVSAILSSIDINTFKKLGIELTNEAVYEGAATTETE